MTARALVLHADWPAPRGVRAFTTLRHGCGVSPPPFDTFNLGNRSAADGDDPQAVARNRAMLVVEAGLPCAPHWLRQVHGVDVVRFETPAVDDASEPVADAAATSTPGVVLSVLTADCLPVVFAAESGDGIAVAHAGWRGLAAGVLESALAAMRMPADDVIVWLGPAAGPLAYEIGEEVYHAFTDPDPRAVKAFRGTRPGRWRVDLYALARMRLADAGVTRIFGGGLCTISDPQRFFSHRRDARTGRMATVAWIEEGGGHERR
ncbi:MAG: peptidoglycan editing factor PgeF [Lysobacteraceae bacterium]|nr:MAG: peptidoglycan editing factor PgeF [Xanthomonadaceae bacterium]